MKRRWGLVLSLSLFAVACGGEATGETELTDSAVEAETDAVEVDRDDPRSSLRVDAAAVTALWKTDWSRSTVPLGEFAAGLRGSDPRDGIPPIDAPLFEDIGAARDWLVPNEPGALVTVDGEARFYPLSILTRHEIVNDNFGEVPVAVTFCPLCNTAVAFDRRVDGDVLRFGVSGLLRKSDLVMWDDLTESLWQQITGEGVVGFHAGTHLDIVPTSIVAFDDFAEAHPDGRSLSRDTGYPIAYGANPYTGYSSLEAPVLQFFADDVDDRLPALERVVAVTIGEQPVAFPFSVLESEPSVNTEIDDTPVAVFWGGATLDALDQARIATSRQIGSGIAYERTVSGQILTFVANGDDTFTDTETGTTWSLLGLGIEGDLAGEQLVVAPHRNEFWFAFAGFFPEAAVYGI